MDPRYAALAKVLADHGQSHLLTFYDDLDPDGRARLLDQIESINWDQIDRLIESHVHHKPAFELPEDLQPAPYYPIEPDDQLRAKYQQATEEGERLVRDGKVACFVVAGGSGTRLGWDGPKGTFPATPVEAKPLFQVFAEGIRANEIKYGAAIPWLVMTSPANDQQTRAFFEQHDHFGLNADQVVFFAQGTMPAIAYDGRVLLADKDELALSADGHGGSLKAIHRSGALQTLKQRGIERLSYFQVDNPTVKVVDPLFIGLHALDHAQMSSKMVAKAYGKEKLGNFCLIDGKMTIVEYSDLPDDLAEERDAQGELRFRAGSPAIHVIDVEFIDRLNRGGELQLPYHRAEKKVPHLDTETAEHVDPQSPNAVKLEQFVFDALPLCDTSIILQTTREEEMAFIKNAEGESSPRSSRQLQSDRACRWLAQAGVDVPGPDEDGHFDCVVELSPLTAVAPEDLNHAAPLKKIEPGDKLSL